MATTSIIFRFDDADYMADSGLYICEFPTNKKDAIVALYSSYGNAISAGINVNSETGTVLVRVSEKLVSLGQDYKLVLAY